jgi:hypothetical protein
VEARVQDLLEAIEQHPSEDKTMWLIEINSLKLIKACGIDGIPD